MPELEKEQVVKLILGVAFLVAAVLFGLPLLQSFRLENYEGLEKRLGHVGALDMGVGILEPVNIVSTNDLRKIDREGAYYVSEIACSIAEDIYYDFTLYGERGRDSLLSYTGPNSAFVNEPNCEWVWEKPCCPAPLNSLLTMLEQKKGGYRCLVNSDKFYVKKNELLPDAAKIELQNLDCSTECINPSSSPTREYELDEVCVNKNLASYNFPDPSYISFCTDGPDEYIMLDYGLDRERQKFGNDVCYANNNNGAAWASSCNCVAAGTRYDGTALTERDTNRLHKWKVDNTISETANDKGLKENVALVADKKYFYTLYWNNNDDEADETSRGYEVEFPSVVNENFIETKKTFNTRSAFIDFVNGFFDEDGDVRNLTAGRWYPELRTDIDGMVTVGSLVNINDILGALEGLDISNFISYEELCTYERDCLTYDIETTVWEEAIDIESDWCGIPFVSPPCDDKTWSHPHESPVLVKHTKNIANQLEANKEYRVIIRNWVSNWYMLEAETCDHNHWWCKKENEAAGKKIYCSQTKDDTTCLATYLYAGGQGVDRNKLMYHRFTDRAVIIIQLPKCTDSDLGKAYFAAGTVTIEDEISEPRIFPDECIDKRFLDEKYCTDSKEVGSETHDCDPLKCANGACGG